MSPQHSSALKQLTALAHRYKSTEERDRLAADIAGADRIGGKSVYLRQQWQLDQLDLATARQAAVLMLFGALDDVPADYRDSAVPKDLDLLFVERASTLSKHPGQVAFPGGKVDATDASPVAAALREAQEETGLDPDGVEVLCSLPLTPLPVTNFLVTPVLGWWTKPSDIFVVSETESQRVFRAPVADLVNPDNRAMATLRRGEMIHKSPGFRVCGTLIWGFTGFLVDRLLSDLGWAQEWDKERSITPPLAQSNPTLPPR